MFVIYRYFLTSTGGDVQSDELKSFSSMLTWKHASLLTMWYSFKLIFLLTGERNLSSDPDPEHRSLYLSSDSENLEDELLQREFLLVLKLWASQSMFLDDDEDACFFMSNIEKDLLNMPKEKQRRTKPCLWKSPGLDDRISPSLARISCDKFNCGIHVRLLLLLRRLFGFLSDPVENFLTHDSLIVISASSSSSMTSSFCSDSDVLHSKNSTELSNSPSSSFAADDCNEERHSFRRKSSPSRSSSVLLLSEVSFSYSALSSLSAVFPSAVSSPAGEN